MKNKTNKIAALRISEILSSADSAIKEVFRDMMKSQDFWPEDIDDRLQDARLAVNKLAADLRHYGYEDTDSPLDSLIKHGETYHVNDNDAKLFCLAISTWDAADHFSGSNCSPMSTDCYLFASRDAAIDFAKSLDKDISYYNEATLYHAALSDEDILEVSGFESMADLKDALDGGYSSSPNRKNYGEKEMSALAAYIAEEHNDTAEEISCSNFDFGKSIAGSIIVVWRWHRHIGYAREIIDVRYAGDDETMALIAKSDRTSDKQADIVMTMSAEEVAACDNLHEALTERLIESGDWRWTRESDVKTHIDGYGDY